MNSASLASLTAGLTLVCIEVYDGFCKAVYNSGAKLMISNVCAANLYAEHTVPMIKC